MSPPPAGGPVAAAVAPYWPELEPAKLDSIAQLHQHWETQLDDAAEKSDNYFKAVVFEELFKGQSADKLQTGLGKIANSWRHDAAQHKSAAAALRAAAADLQDLQNDLRGIINADEPAYEAAIAERDQPLATQIVAGAESAAKTAATYYAGRIHAALTGKFGKPPPGTNTGGTTAVLDSFQTSRIPGAGGTPPSAPGSLNGVGSTGAGQTPPVPATTPIPPSVGSGASTPASGGAPVAGSAPVTGGAGAAPGVAPGVGNSGVPSTVVPPQMYGSPAGLAPAPKRGKDDPATSSAAADLSPLSPDGVSGSGGGAAVGGGGGAMMPMAPQPGPMAPYSPPLGSSTSSPPASTPAGPPGPPPGSAAAGAGALLAGSGAVDRSVRAATAKPVNPDLVSARRVLAGLVKACPARPIFWAVLVLRTPVGPQTLIAGSVGGGAYLPPEVSVPSTVRLAVLDPALPSGWAAAWMGWQSPLAILVDHYERVAKVVAGVTVSAMMTSELWPKRPDCGGDFSAVRHEELVTSTAPPLVGGHRLTATDPALAARLTALDKGGDTTIFAAAQLTRAVWTAAAQPDDTGLPIAVQEDADILGLVAEGKARREDWDNYRRDVERRADGAVMMPEIHAPRDADDSPASVTARMWYRHYYARGRIAEMVTCWANQPVNILDIAYCGVAAGFGAVIAVVVTELEKRLAAELPGPAGGT